MQLSTSLKAEWKGEGREKFLLLTEATESGPREVRVPYQQSRSLAALIHTEVKNQTR